MIIIHKSLSVWFAGLFCQHRIYLLCFTAWMNFKRLLSIKQCVYHRLQVNRNQNAPCNSNLVAVIANRIGEFFVGGHTGARSRQTIAGRGFLFREFSWLSTPFVIDSRSPVPKWLNMSNLDQLHFRLRMKIKTRVHSPFDTVLLAALVIILTFWNKSQVVSVLRGAFRNAEFSIHIASVWKHKVATFLIDITSPTHSSTRKPILKFLLSNINFSIVR